LYEAPAGEGNNEAAFRYGSALVITLAPWSPEQRASVVLGDQAKAYGVGELTTISGNPAWLVPADAQAKGFPPVNVLHLGTSDLDITLFGVISMDELVEIAKGLKPI